MNNVNNIEQVLEDLKKGNMAVLIDDKDKESEGMLFLPAACCSPETINFMSKHGRGLICIAITPERAKELRLFSADENTSLKKTIFAVPVDAKININEGISASARAKTIETIINPTATSEDLVKPGHIFPIIVREGGVLIKAALPEAAVDLAKAAGFYPAGAICKIINEDGCIAKLPEIKQFAITHEIKICAIADIINFRWKKEKLVKKEIVTSLPTIFGEFTLIAYKSLIEDRIHLALVKGEIHNKEDVLVRVHSQCLTGDVFNSLRCDCGQQLNTAMRLIQQKGYGVILYLNQEGRGIGLLNKLRAYQLQSQGMDTVEANEKLGFAPDLRDYGIGAQILADLGLHKIKLLTNNPRKIVGLQGYGLEVVERVPLEMKPNEANIYYLETKQKKLGHMLNLSTEKYQKIIDENE